ncbi:hypothetical protein HDU87_004387 [Geranomyces variabilis]|uniref:Cytochrome c oxidase assembly protein COX20, mitochondrial n=1 Tax=Geranomyces variabilis TaxID=109894 RepID=A0AAD5TK93_9FUNG|nr:hypothetical protein HDU87_004387 [Geranomyces variabilis]
MSAQAPPLPPSSQPQALDGALPPQQEPTSIRRPPGMLIDPTKKPSFFEVASGIAPDEFKLANVAKAPCARKALLYGIGGGTVVAATRMVVTRRPLSSGNWGFAAFGAISTLSWEFCRHQRRVVQEELEKMSAANARRTEEEKRENLAA